MKQSSSPSIHDILDVALEAGRAILGHYAEAAVIESKADDSPLTQADRAAHRVIMARLGALAPEAQIISEESPDEIQRQTKAREFWLVDPLDGTKEFIKKSGEFTVNIALVRDGVPVLGVVHAPVLNLSYLAGPGTGACRVRGEGAPEAISTSAAPGDLLRVVASKDHAGPEVERMLGRVARAELLSMGSSLKFCLVAEGKADLYPRFVPTMEWDTAAAQCVVEAAGGAVTDLKGQRLLYGKSTLKNPSIMTFGDRGLDWSRYLTR